MVFNRCVFVFMCVSLSSAVRILSQLPAKCSRQDLNCTVTESNCLDSKWLNKYKYTPSSPEELQVSVSTRQDEAGHLHPVLDARWKIRDDGSICYLQATEIHVLVMSTNQNMCVRYSFGNQLDMRSPSGEKWSFSADMFMLEPGKTYHVSVFNIPKPEEGHSSYDVSRDVSVPDCFNRTMRRTQFCIERGSLWQPNISLSQLTEVSGRSVLSVSFTPDQLCDKYLLIVRCHGFPPIQHKFKANQTTLNATFDLDRWPRSCCQFDAEIKPFFPQCGQDCTRRKKTFHMCPHAKPNPRPDVPQYMFVMVLLCVVVVVVAGIIFVLCRRQGKGGVPAKPKKQEPQLPKESPKLLVIYSQDHRLYKDVVLSLCAFLQAKCGITVLVDLLDSKLVGEVGGPRWMEWQRQQLNNPCDKILVLCSPGVQAKWRAMCGKERVMLREDILSPTDDMLTPFLNLFLPNMHQAGMMGKYLVAYFENISGEQDVPSVFDIAVKYKLMKHFEALFYRILDLEKYQPGQVSHIEGIGVEEYLTCPSGRALKNAIDTFHAYQLENPDWFEKECVRSEEEVLEEADLLVDQPQISPVLECVPLIRNELPVYIRDVDINENVNSVHVLIPELSSEAEQTSELTPVCQRQHPASLYEVLTNHVYPPGPRPDTDSMAEEDSLLLHRRCLVLQTSVDPPQSSSVCMQSECVSPPKLSHPQPVEVDEYEGQSAEYEGQSAEYERQSAEYEGQSAEYEVQSAESDQGYISQQQPPSLDVSLEALKMLQQELVQRDLSITAPNPEF